MPRRLLRSLAALALALACGLALVRTQAPSLAAAPAGREAAWRENNLGVALLEQFRFADALPAFRRALEADPTLTAAQVNLAIAHFYVPDVPAAKQAAQKALEATPAAPHPNYLLALVARSEGQAEQALPHLQQVLAVDPTDLGANVTLGQVYLQLRRFEDAIAAFRVALAAEPYNVSAAYNLAVALNRADRRDEGQQAMARFQLLRDSPYKTALSASYLEQGRYAEAVSSTGAEADAVDPKTPAVSFVQKEDRPATRRLGRARPGGPGARRPRRRLWTRGRGGERGIAAHLEEGRGRPRRRDRALGPRGHGCACRSGRRCRQRRPARPARGALARPVALPQRGRRSLRGPQPQPRASPPVAPATGTAAFVDVDHDGDLDVLAAGVLLPEQRQRDVHGHHEERGPRRGRPDRGR